MEAKLYAIPVGAFGNEIMTIMEICIPSILLSINEEGNHLFDSVDEIKERYNELNEIKTIQISPEQATQFSELKETIIKENELKTNIFIFLDESIKECMEEMNGPHIQMATEMDLQMLADSEIGHEDEDYPKLIL